MKRIKNGRNARFVLLIIFLLVLAGVLFFIFRARRITKTYPPLSKIYTLTETDKLTTFNDPFGIAVAPNGDVFVTDGETGKLWSISPNGESKVIAENLDVPSCVAIAPDGSLVVAETGAHRIVRIHLASGRIETVAGVKGRSGDADGNRDTALFNAPIGLTVARDGTIFVADTYNDRIRAIDPQGNTRTLAGGETGFADGARDGAKFDTPCGIALLSDNSLVVADTGNNRLRRVLVDGTVTTIAGDGEAREQDGESANAAFNEPTGVVVGERQTIYVADAGGNALRVVRIGATSESNKNENDNEAASENHAANDNSAANENSATINLSNTANFNKGIVTTLVGGYGLIDGDLSAARLLRPSNVAIAPDGTLDFADTGNGLVRAVIGAEREHGAPLDSERAKNLKTTDVEKFRAAAPPRWCYDPPQQPREIAATFGEVRGFVEPNKESHFHNGLDVPGALGETVRAVREERALRPISVNDVGTARERIRFPTLGYIHVRIGRDANEKNLNENRFTLRRDERGRVIGVRVRRGEKFAAGDAIGTLNTQYHCHLIAGRVGAEVNALAALELPGVRDTVAPTVEAVEFFDRNWTDFSQTGTENGAKGALNEKTAKAQINGRANHKVAMNNRANDKAPTSDRVSNSRAQLTLRGDVRIIVRAYDQMNDNQARRRLGVYRLGYQILNADKTPAKDFNESHLTISFERLPEMGDAAVPLVYAPHSQAGYSPQTIFDYIVTDWARDGEAREDFWHTAQYPPGVYVVRVFAEDFFGNRTTRDVMVRVESGS